MSATDLTPKQQCFVDEYLIDFNATQAAIRAGYSARTARVIGQENLLKPAIAAALARAQAGRRIVARITADEVVEGLARIARASIADVVDWGVKDVAIGYDDEGRRLLPEQIDDAVVVHYVEQPYVRPINRDQLTPQIRDAIAEIALTPSGFKVKMHDKMGAWERLGRHLGVFRDEGPPPGVVNFNIYGLHDPRKGQANERPPPRRVEGTHTFDGDPAGPAPRRRA